MIRILKNKIPLWKRIIDIGCVFVTLPVTVPIALIISIYIKLVSKGPVLFRQERVGLDCNLFTCYKFRSMHLNSDVKNHADHVSYLIKSNNPMSKIDNDDPRLIIGAKLIRSIGLDELPQLWNVLKGDMSIVGPRPCVKYEFDQYEPWQKERFKTLPGITGLWQVSGKNKTTFKKMIELDIEYVQNLNFFDDLKIIANTIPFLLAQAIESKQKPQQSDLTILGLEVDN